MTRHLIALGTDYHCDDDVHPACTSIAHATPAGSPIVLPNFKVPRRVSAATAEGGSRSIAAPPLARHTPGVVSGSSRSTIRSRTNGRSLALRRLRR